MVEKLKNWVMQNIAIVITVMVVISIAILSCFMPDNIEKIFDKIFSYLGVVAIPLVVWYLGNQKELNEQKRLEEERLNQEKQREQDISDRLNEYKKQIVDLIKQAKENCFSDFLYADGSIKNGVEPNWALQFQEDNLQSLFRQMFNGEDPTLITDLLRKLKILTWNENTEEFWMLTAADYEYKYDDDAASFFKTLETIIEKVENGEYDSNIREFIEREI